MTGSDLKRLRVNACLSRANMAIALGYTSSRHTRYRLMDKYERQFEHEDLPSPVVERIRQWQTTRLPGS